LVNSSSHLPTAQDLDSFLKRVHDHCQEFKAPIIHRSVLQAGLTLFLYLLLCTAMVFFTKAGFYWVCALLAVPTAGLLVKMFIVQHDCGHGSYFKSKATNNFVGRLFSLATFTPFAFWRDAHNRHHASSGNLSKRGIGAIDTLTLEEFRNLKPWQQRLYKVYRHPIVMVLIGPPLYIIILQRLPLKGSLPFSDEYHSINGRHLWKSVMTLNIGLLVVYGTLAWLIGLSTVLIVFMPALFISASVGGWLFYVQHQYEDSYWEHHEEWDFRAAALLGSSHYDLPKVLHWFTGNIGFHHIHHLSSLIPNYRLPECYEASDDLKALPKMSMLDSLKTARLRFWDEVQKKMVTA